jgi:transcriptional regulator with XRE-family HTH domain
VEACVAREVDEVAGRRRDLGRQLAERRKAAGYVQREFGALLGYSRTAVANAETGHARIGRQLWERADRVLGTGQLFARGFDRIRAQASAAAQAGSAVSPISESSSAGSAAAVGGLGSLALAEARLACREWGWPAEEDPGGRLWLVTGAVIDALEVPRAAGMVAVAWWLYTRGVPDEIRGLPALPDPDTALAVIAAGERCYFLARSGASPWTRRDAAEAGSAGVAPVRWHAGGSRVLAPPSPLPGGDCAAWAHVPSAGGGLASPMALLHLLAQAVTATRDRYGLVLPGAVRAVPASGGSLPEDSHG